MTIAALDGSVYRVADAHAHVYKEKIASKASTAIGAFYRTDMYESVPTASNLLAKAGALGVEKFLIFSVATTVKQVSSINHFIADEVASAPDSFLGLGTAHPDMPDFGVLFDELDELGLKGIKLHPDMQYFNIDDPRMMPLYREAAKRGLVMLLHVGDERYDYSAPERLMRVLEEVPDLKVHAAHFGCCRIWKRRPLVIEAAVRAGANIAFDTSSMLGWASVEEARYLVDHLGVDRIMWGTDYPMWSPENEFARLLALGYSHEENQKMLYDNFARFYGVD
ncbi:amidohydrolase family protein [Denitrobacterium detoxificans]|jgi:hypothetical protein|uniref:amidohydrolase family protein n=1 Tax=Denitrobacterium detoxificans TaxID=79604 RepID=UPI0026EDBF6F|nr:amidohydrolase family protein [Denitrobacterium detoxificans]MBE6466833.1 hypothetical protein [Denitrobacterium detoxificans]